MSENKFIKHLRGEDTAKSVLEIKNQKTLTSFGNMPEGNTSNANDVYSDHRGDAVGVLKGTENWKLNGSGLIETSSVYGDGRDFTDSFDIDGSILWVNATYTFATARRFAPNTKFVLKLCGHDLNTAVGDTIGFTLLVKFGTNDVISKTFNITEQAFDFCKEFVIDFGESNTSAIKVAVGSTMTVQLVCADPVASATIYNGMTVFTALQRRVDSETVSSDTLSLDEIEHSLTTHINDKNNPHEVTKAQVELGNCDNTSDLDKPISTATQTALDGKQATISDLATIRSGAALGSTALQPTDVVNNVTSTATNKPLSANMGKVLQDQINNHQTIGKFLSFWDCTTGLPLTNPQTSPYTYHTGDYYRIKTVASAGGTNYRPSGSSYTTGVASTTVETEIVTEGQVYYYDGTSWGLAGGGSVTVDNSTVSYNDNSELQTIGVIDNNSNAIKVWTGELADLPTVKDPNTLYNITDDVGGGDDIYTKSEVDSLINGMFTALYPVGSLYFGETCPLSNIISGSVWVNIGTGIVTDVDSSASIVGVKGTGSGGSYFLATTSSFTQRTKPSEGGYSVSATPNTTIPGASASIGSAKITINVWKRTA